MPDTVIQVENLSKKYVLAHQSRGAGGSFKYKRFSDALIQTATAPFRALRRDGKASPSSEIFWALHDVSFEVKRGEVIGIIGRNGAGKSTLLKVLSRITEPTAGRVVINGRVASLLEVGTGFHPELTGRENIYLNGAILGMKRAEITRKFDEIVAFAEVDKFLDTPVKHFSSGMYVRLAFAVAAHLDPEILIVDEVLAVGDISFQKKCLGKMENVAGKEGRTVIFVSHDLAAVRQLCRHAIVLERGRVSFQGPTPSAIHHYLESAGVTEERLRPVVEPPPYTRMPLWLKRASLQSESGEDGQVFLNQSLSVKFEFVSREPTRSVIVGMVIYDSQNRALLNTNNLYQKYTPLAEPVTSGQLICELGSVPLMPGHYSISLWLGLSENELQVIEHALTFVVLARDAWETGRLPPENVSPLWWPTSFKLLPPT